MSEQNETKAVKNGWIEREFAHLSLEELFEDEILKAILTVIQDGICFLSPGFDVLYANPAMRFWYEMDRESIGAKCYEAYHNRKEPCENCPALKVLETRLPANEEKIYEKKGKKEGWQSVFCTPILDGSGNVIMVIEYVRDMTNETKHELSLELMNQQVQTLTELIEQKEEERRQKEQQLVGNMNKSIETVLRYLSRMLDESSFDMVRRHLDITRYGVEKDSALAVKLSGQELTIARYIAEGYVSKEIADEMNISKKTVDYHRTNLRKKLDLKADDNLKDAIREFLIKTGL